MEIVAYPVTHDSSRLINLNSYIIKIHKTPTGFSGRTIKIHKPPLGFFERTTGYADLIFDNPVDVRPGSSFETVDGYILIVDDVGDIHVVTHDEYVAMKGFCVDVDVDNAVYAITLLCHYPKSRIFR